MSHVPELVDIPPRAQFVTDEEAEALLRRQLDIAKAMGSKWLLHKVNEVQRKSV